MRVSTFLVDAFHALKIRTGGPGGLRLAFCGVFLALLSAAAAAGEWPALAKDGIHDPRSRGTKILQQPAEALSRLTPDNAGNQVRWVQALEKGEIRPREKLFPQTVVRKLDQDIILDTKGGMPAVRFPHRQHTEWLDCVNCHEGIFKTQIGASKISMFKILQGEQCGVCHGAVAFPLTECMRCHSIVKPGSSKPVIPSNIDLLMHQRNQGQP
jgi:c(7)-type cytochrome triheme protein